MTVFTAKYIGCFDEAENGGNVTLAAAGPDLTPVTCLGRCNTPFAQLAPWNATAVACTCMPQFEIKKVPTEQCFLLCKDKIHYCGGFSPDHTRLWSMYEKIPMPSMTEKAAKTTTKCAFCYSGGDKSTTSIVTTTNHVPPFGHFSSNLGQHSTTTTRVIQLPPVTSNQPELPLSKSPIQDPKTTTSQTNVIDIPSSTTIAIGGGEGGGVVSSLDEGDGVMRISSSPTGNPITAGPSATTVTDTPGNPRPPPPAPLPTLITPEPNNNNNNNQFTAPLIVVLSVVAITVFSAFTAYRRRKKSRSSDFQPSPLEERFKEDLSLGVNPLTTDYSVYLRDENDDGSQSDDSLGTSSSSPNPFTPPPLVGLHDKKLVPAVAKTMGRSSGSPASLMTSAPHVPVYVVGEEEAGQQIQQQRERGVGIGKNSSPLDRVLMSSQSGGRNSPRGMGVLRK